MNHIRTSSATTFVQVRNCQSLAQSQRVSRSRVRGKAAAEAEMTPLNNPTPTETMETAETKSQEKHQDEEPKDHATQAADVSEFSVAYSF